jgi:TolB-like protein
MPTGAVFLSYASEDAAAAERICASLRAAGIEVWFDQSELRGGDAWDAAIRKQIKGCALFIPVISRNAHARMEGYFRLEWKLAVDRSYLMASDKAFLLPIAIDDTPQTDERIPDRFREVQWSRLRAGEATPTFVDRVSRLLSSEPGPAEAAAIHATAAPAGAMATRRAAAPWRSRSAVLMMAAVAVAAVAYFSFQRFTPAKHAADAHASPAVPERSASLNAVPEKSVAVLPFLDMSEKKDQEYFSDGLSEELIDMLTKIPELRVPARTSSFYFKGKQATLPDIAKALSVTHVLEGSVRKSGNALRITAQLIRVDTGYHLWSETYDRELNDIFKIQDDIAGAVVKALKISLLNGEPPHAAPAANSDAYVLQLKAKFFGNRQSPGDIDKALDLLQQAVKLDPTSADAWARLSFVLRGRSIDYGLVPWQQVREQALSAAQRSLALNPRSAIANLAIASIKFADWNWQEAQASYDRVRSLDPNVGDTLGVDLLYTHGHLEKAIQLQERARARDPLSVPLNRISAGLFLDAGRLPEAEAAARTASELNPVAILVPAMLGQILVARGASEAGLAEIKHEPDEETRDFALAWAFVTLGRKAAAAAALDHLERMSEIDTYGVATLHAMRNERELAFTWLERAYQQHDTGLTRIILDPDLKNLRTDPRYKAFLRKMNLPE